MPARKGRRAGQPVQPREIPFTAARRAVLAAIRCGRTGYTTLTSAPGKLRTIIDRNRHRARKAKCPSAFAHASRAGTVTRTARAVITLTSKPAWAAKAQQPPEPLPRKPPAGPWSRPLPGTTRRTWNFAGGRAWT